MAYRYFRFRSTELRDIGITNAMQLSEIAYYVGGTRINATAYEASGAFPENEAPSFADDADTATKALIFNNIVTYPWITYDFGSIVDPDTYSWATANDATDRDPIRWVVEGSNDNATWTIVDDQSAADYPTPTSRLTWLPTFPIAGGGGGVQLIAGGALVESTLATALRSEQRPQGGALVESTLATALRSEQRPQGGALVESTIETALRSEQRPQGGALVESTIETALRSEQRPQGGALVESTIETAFAGDIDGAEIQGGALVESTLATLLRSEQRPQGGALVESAIETALRSEQPLQGGALVESTIETDFVSDVSEVIQGEALIESTLDTALRSEQRLQGEAFVESVIETAFGPQAQPATRPAGGRQKTDRFRIVVTPPLPTIARQEDAPRERQAQEEDELALLMSILI